MLPVQHAVCVYCNSQILGMRTLQNCALFLEAENQEQRRESTRPVIWGIAATGILSPIPAIMNIKAETLPQWLNVSVSYLPSLGVFGLTGHIASVPSN